MRSFSCAALLVAAPLTLSAQDTPAPGFALLPAAYPGSSPFAASTNLSNGDIVIFDGTDVVQYTADGTFLITLGSLTETVFPSFVVADPDEELLFVGESSHGHIYRLFLGLSADPERLVTLPFNYDAAVVEPRSLYVSAATCGFNCGNEIWRVDLRSRQATLVALLPGASGPIAFDPQGNLYYGTASADFPPPPKPSAVWRWSADRLDGPHVLGLDDAQLVGDGFSGATRLAYLPGRGPHAREAPGIDPGAGTLFLMENNFATGENRIRRVLGSADESPVLVEGRPFQSMGNLTLRRGQGPARFLAYQPSSGGELTYTTTDFTAPAERVEVRPLRPVASLSVPVPDELQLALENGPPGGFARILFCPRARLPAMERVFALAGLPLFFGLDLSTQGVLSGLFRLDPDGRLLLSMPDAQGLGGSVAFQLLLLDALRRAAGTSSVAVL